MTSQKCYFRSAIIHFSQCKSNCPKVLASSLLKPMPPCTLSLRTSACCLPAQQVGRRKVGTYTFTITKSEARKNLRGFQILMFCNWFSWFSFSQKDIQCWEPGSAMYVREPPFLELIFQLFVSTLFTCSLHSTEIHEKHRCLQILSVCSIR